MPVVSYSVKDISEIVKLYYAERSYASVKRRFKTKFGRTAPSLQAIKKIIKKFERSGCVCNDKRSGRPRSVRSEENIAQISALLETDSSSSVRMIASETGIKRESVRKILRKDMKLKPYKVNILHELLAQDFLRREQFCREMLDFPYISDICFSDEAYFYLDKSVTSKKIRIWSDTNPHAFLKSHCTQRKS